MMEASIRDHQLTDDTHSLFDVTFFSSQILTLLTHSPPLVNRWLAETRQLHRSTPTVVGLDVEWRPNFSRNSDNPVALLQLSAGSRCLIFQIKHAPYVPQSLKDFLRNESGEFVFAGVGIEGDVEKLVEDYDLAVSGTVDLRGLAAEKLGAAELKSAGLKELARRVLGRGIVKPKSVTMSRWDCEWLTLNQVQYACIDAFLSAEIGRALFAMG